MLNPDISKPEHGGRIKEYSEKYGRNFLDFSASLNPMPPHLNTNFDPSIFDHYPDDTYCSLKKSIAKLHHRKMDEIVVGNGSAELIRVFCLTILGKGKKALIPKHTFNEYEVSAHLAGAEVINEKTCDLPFADVSFLCNPNNPTGKLLSRTEVMQELRETSENSGMLFVDEAFIDLAEPEESISDFSDSNLFVMRSLTKAFAIPGIRFGYGFGDPLLIEKMEAVRPPWSVGAAAENMALQAFSCYKDLEKSRNYIKSEREKMVSRLTEMGFECYPPSANYILFNTGSDVSQFCEKLVKHGILVRNCRSFGLPDCIRVSVRKKDENMALLEAIEKCLQ